MPLFGAVAPLAVLSAAYLQRKFAVAGGVARGQGARRRAVGRGIQDVLGENEAAHESGPVDVPDGEAQCAVALAAVRTDGEERGQ